MWMRLHIMIYVYNALSPCSIIRFIYKPYSIYVPIYLQARVKGELYKMIHLGVIEEAIYHTEWCCPMIVAMKSQGRIRDMQ